MQLDSRIGKYAYLKPGLGISGGNLERDIVNLNKISSQLNIKTSLFDVYLDESYKRKQWIVKIIQKYKNAPFRAPMIIILVNSFIFILNSLE